MTAAASSAASGWAESGTEARAEATGTEAPSEAPAETGPERPVVTGVVASDKLAEFTAGLLALFVQGAAVLGCESEARRSRYTREWPAYMGLTCFKEWVVH